jgi:tetratricopeptide (TPR) repeat protein
MAGPPTGGYRLRKLLRRHKAIVGGIAAVLVVSVIGTIVSVNFAIGQARASAEAQLIADFLENDVLGSAVRARADEATVSYILDAASERLDGKFKDRPLIEASIRRKLAGIYRLLGESQKAEQHTLDAALIYRHYYGEDHPTTRSTETFLGWVYEDQGRYREMEDIWTKHLKFRQRVSGVEFLPGIMNALGAAYWHLGKYKEAESLFEKILQSVPSNHGLFPWFRCNLARVYASQGRYEEAQELLEKTLKTIKWPDGHVSISSQLIYTSALADAYREQGNYGKAEELFDGTLETMRQQLGIKHIRTLKCVCGLLQLYVNQDRYDEAKTLLKEALPIARQRLRKEHPLILRFVNASAVLHTKQKQFDVAQSLFNEALEGRKRELGDDHPDTLESKNDLAILYKEQELYDKAEKFLLEALEGRRLKLGDTHPDTLESWHNLIELYEAWGKPEKAEEWRSKVPPDEVVEGLRKGREA